MQKPMIFNYQDPVLFMKDQIAFLKASQRSYSITKSCRHLRRCSPSLISNILSGKRRITEDRLQDIATVLQLNFEEKEYFTGMVTGENEQKPDIGSAQKSAGRRRVSSFILNDWINPFVKDAVRLASVKQNLEAIYGELSNLATRKRINRSIEFLLKHGYLRKTLSGELVEAEPLHVVGDQHADKKVRHFHKQTLEVAKKGLDRFTIEERLAQAMIFPIDEESHDELREIISEFSDNLKEFSEKHAKSNQRLYQLILHLTPTGGSK